MSSAYESDWWYGDVGQRIARIKLECLPHNASGEKLWTNDFVIMVAKAAYEYALKEGERQGYHEGWEACRTHILDRI
jgi:hypothetical protein